MADTLPLSSPVVVGMVPTSLVGAEINGYVVEQALSSGGMGVVYRARHPLIGRTVAIKVLRPEMMERADVRDRFVREARALSAIRHSNVVEILNFGALPNDQGQYLMMEMLEGETLCDIIAREAPMSPRAALKHCEDILLGLAAAHAVGVVHRDLKPANIVLTAQSSGERLLKVLDFGLARQLDTTPEAPSASDVAAREALGTSLLAGTPEYISPEQAAGKHVGAAGDLYCLGVMLFEMLTGQLPFRASGSPWELLEMHMSKPAPRASSLNPAVPAEVDALVASLLEKTPSLRPASASAARIEVSRLLEVYETRHATPTLQLRQMLRPRVSVPALAGVVGLGVLMMVGHLMLSEPVAAMPTAAAATAPTVPNEMIPPPPMVPAPAMTDIAVVTTTPPAPVARLTPRRLSPRLAASCDPQWQSGAREQIDELEKLALSRLPDDAEPSQVGEVKDHARQLASRVRHGGTTGCGAVESALQVWRAALR